MAETPEAEMTEPEAAEPEATEPEAAEMAEEHAEEALPEETQVEETQVEETAETPAEPAEAVVEAAPEPAPESSGAAAPADMTIQPIDPGSAKMAPVAFSHATHQATDCAVCHHKGANTSCSSAGCHTDTANKKIEAGATENVSFEAAFHDRNSDKSCVGCHRAEKAGPTKCNDCHPK